MLARPYGLLVSQAVQLLSEQDSSNMNSLNLACSTFCKMRVVGKVCLSHTGPGKLLSVDAKYQILAHELGALSKITPLICDDARDATLVCARRASFVIVTLHFPLGWAEVFGMFGDLGRYH